MKKVRQQKAQSAMEYLSTYAWAILIIAIVLAALSTLGLFNPQSFAPKAAPGSCQVYRPAGPWTISLISLTGLCSGEIPQYTAVMSSASNPNVIVSGNFNGIATGAGMTVTAWVYPTSFTAEQGVVWREAVAGGSKMQFGLALESTGKVRWLVSSTGIAWINTYDSTNTLLPNSWTFIAGTWDGTTQYEYINSALDNAGVAAAGTIFPSNAPLSIGAVRTNTNGFNGKLANIQIYNYSLSANEVQAIYIEGIGGAPLVLRYLAGWFPLNGNANDYSGDNLTSGVNSVSFSTNWYNGYNH